MTRAHVTALALVNWKGVFYERYRLDRHVTALEGANGAGKTTVMIAAYVVLLPDMSRLRFTNVAETGGGGADRGIWGRLGEEGRPSYAVLDVQLADDRRIVAGVRLERRSEPTVEATPFLIEGLPAETALSELLLVRNGDQDQIAELDEIKAAVRRAGARVEVFRSIREYFTALFEREVTPLRLASDEDRSKWSEMLRTSMTGGISRALTTDLRSFLLKEEAGLGDVLGRMRANLDACRRTRSEVAESRVMERDITGVYEAGQAMFSCAHHAARLAAEEGRANVEQARLGLERASRNAAELLREIDGLSAREALLAERAVAAQHTQATAQAELERLLAAHRLEGSVRSLAEELASLVGIADAARAQQVAASLERGARRDQRSQTQESYQRAALGLAHLQQGLDELHRRAHAHRLLGQRLTEARTLLARPELQASDAAQALARIQAERASLLSERARHERARDSASARSEERARALDALQRLETALASVDGAPAADALDPLTRARQVLARLSEHDGERRRLSGLEQERIELERRVAQQTAARDRARGLGLEIAPGVQAELERALVALEEGARAVDAEIRAAEQSVADTRAARLGARDSLTKLEDRARRWALLRAAIARVNAAGTTPVEPHPLLPPLAAPEDLPSVRAAAAQQALGLAERRGQLSAEREQCLRMAAELAGPGAALDPELVRLRDELGAELLLSRFDDVPEDEAAALEARLGPLVHALVVPDPLSAAEALLDAERSLETVWLVRAGTDLEGVLVQAGKQDVVVTESFGARITRQPAWPSVGAGARAAHATRLRTRAEAIGGELEQLALQGRQLATIGRDLDLLAGQIELWASGDPLPLMAASVEAHRVAAEAELGASDRLEQARADASALRAEHARLQPLRADAGLLEPPEYAPRLATLAAEASRVQGLQRALAPLAAARHQLGELAEVLRTSASEQADPAHSATRIAALSETLERGYRAAAALEDVLAQRHACDWQDASELLESQASLVPSLEAQHDRARQALEEADRAVLAADAAWEQATARAQEAEAKSGAASAQHERVSVELDALGGSPPEARISAARSDWGAAAAHASELEREARGLVAELARQRERAESAARQEAAARGALSDAERRATPTATHWEEVRTAADQAQLVPSAALEAPRPTELAAEATSRRALLAERLVRSRGGDTIAQRVADEQLSILAAWQLTRDWLRQRIPLQVSRDEDPLSALEGLRDHLDVLEGRLGRQESDLRGASEDVARAIDVQVRRARGQVRRLNVHLQGVSFGSIASIRVDMRRVERMEQILRALREGDAQELLFVPSLPIEEALEEIFRRYGGGRGGGQRLLDYREYVELVVEIRRQTGDSWEVASPSRLSTGETIGVGAALMMVVLTEWERDSNLLRARSHPGSLRFLFLDEANRLSRDNLGVLFELCRTLDLQLLIAAPEVARAEGNTTYRLIRHVSEDGREEVLVTGRRTLRDAEPVVATES